MTSDSAEERRSGGVSTQSLAGILLLVLFLYVAVEKAGFFAPDGLTLREIIYSPCSRYLVVLFAVSVLVLLVSTCRKISGRPSLNQAGVLLILCAALLFSASVWVSYLYRYEGAIQLAPLMSIDPFPMNYMAIKRHLGSKSSPPTIGITVKNITFHSKSDPAQLASVDADINYAGGGLPSFREGTLNSRIPMFLDNTFVSIVDAGYRVKYHNANIKGDTLDDGQVYLKLIPSGSEDYFTMFAMGYNYALRCYPDYVDNNGVPSTKSLNLNNPVFAMKVSRFKVVNYKGLFTTKDHLKYENLILTLPDVSPWITVRIVRDHGIFVAAAGCVSLISGVLMLLIYRIRRRPIPSSF